MHVAPDDHVVEGVLSGEVLVWLVELVWLGGLDLNVPCGLEHDRVLRNKLFPRLMDLRLGRIEPIHWFVDTRSVVHVLSGLDVLFISDQRQVLPSGFALYLLRLRDIKRLQVIVKESSLIPTILESIHIWILARRRLHRLAVIARHRPRPAMLRCHLWATLRCDTCHLHVDARTCPLYLGVLVLLGVALPLPLLAALVGLHDGTAVVVVGGSGEWGLGVLVLGCSVLSSTAG